MCAERSLIRYLPGCSLIRSFNGGAKVLSLVRSIDSYGPMPLCIIKFPCCRVRIHLLPQHSHSHPDWFPQICFRTVRFPTTAVALPLCLANTICNLTDGIAASVTIGIINYVLLGFQLPVDGFYMHSFEIWLASMVVFFGSGNVGFALLEYRLGQKNLVSWHKILRFCVI